MSSKTKKIEDWDELWIITPTETRRVTVRVNNTKVTYSDTYMQNAKTALTGTREVTLGSGAEHDVPDAGSIVYNQDYVRFELHREK